ncbi:hypothetical protein [Rhizobium mongolense]|uniref:Uncharacterized protein n=2 Tax=Rhizobium mongolense TaxID=57676 RepID=A0ABR6IKW8_9HYPH|nr:hypothetical protein [Rhizobium mongolense]MBB4228497.1 hypothetical protein [Rhizobium mongolense]TVZ64368.1 hypothetical protein BCL32_4610 [Rhizobium mongolense USDA 1844]
MPGQDNSFDSGTDDARCSDTAAAAQRREEAKLQAARGLASGMGHPHEGSLNIKPEDINRARERRFGEIEPDEGAKQAALKEQARLHGDVHIVESDLEDRDQREAAPGTREQK